MTWPGRELRRLADLLEPAGRSPDGKWIYAFRINQRDVFKVDARSGRVEPFATFPTARIEPGAMCTVGPDGEDLVCSLLEDRVDAWIIDNFDVTAR
jgi:hypothetical protein